MDLNRTLVDMDRERRAELLEGTTITLDVRYTGTTAHHTQQLSAAQNLVSRDRYRQLCGQAEKAGHTYDGTSSSPVLVEIPEHALKAVSRFFAGEESETVHIFGRGDGSDTNYAEIKLGGILPGYLMEILDWYCGALRAKSWKDFLPADRSIQDFDKFYWLYIYITMRKIGMDDFANSLGPFVAILVEQHQLVDEAWMLEFILSELTDNDDQLFQVVVERYAKLENAGQSPLFHEQWSVILEEYTHFGDHLRSYVESRRDISDYFSNMMSLAQVQMACLRINDYSTDDMEV
jgi:hypothetical protein